MSLHRNRILHLAIGFALICLASQSAFGNGPFASELEKTIHRESVEEDARGGKSLAILVGAQDYTHFEKLKYCERDVLLLAETLKTSCAFDEVLVMHDSHANPHFRPTMTAMEPTIKNWLALTDSGEFDRLFVYFSGHGYRDEKDGELYLVPSDCNSQRITSFGLQISSLKQRLNSSSSVDTKFLFLDCCHSGSGKSTGIGPDGDMFAKELQSAKGLMTIASCRADQVSLEWPEKGHGLFTYWLCQGLMGHADIFKDGVVDDLELFRYTYRQVLKTSASLGRQQSVVQRKSDDWSGIVALSKVPNVLDATPQTLVPVSVPAVYRPRTVTVPDLSGLSHSKVQAVLDGLGLEGDITTGTVAARTKAQNQTTYQQSPAPGTQLPEGSQVKVVIYDTYRVTVPALNGLSQQEIANLLNDLGLRPDFAKGTEIAPSPSQDEKCYDQRPVAGTQVTPGSEVSVLLFDTYGVRIPSLKGLTTDEARKKLAECGLTARAIGGSQRAPRSEDLNKVYTQVPEADTLVDRGGEVTVKYYYMNPVGRSSSPQPSTSSHSQPTVQSQPRRSNNSNNGWGGYNWSGWNRGGGHW